MRKSKSCGLLEIMCDVVSYWAYDLELEQKISEKDMKELAIRLKKAQKDLNKKFSCIKNKIPI